MSWLSDVLVWLGGVLRPAPPAPTPPTPGGAGAAVLAEVNARRAASRLPPLAAEPHLAAGAQAYADWMAAHGTLTHFGGGTTPWSRMTAAGYAWASASEDIAGGQRSAAEVVADWYADPPHRQALLGPYAQAGVGVAASAAGVLYWVLDLATPAAGR